LNEKAKRRKWQLIGAQYGLAHTEQAL